MAIYKRGRGFELGRTEKQIQEVARAGLEPGTAGLRVRHADHSATLPSIRYLKQFKGWVRNVKKNYGWTALSFVIFVLPS